MIRTPPLFLEPDSTLVMFLETKFQKMFPLSLSLNIHWKPVKNHISLRFSDRQQTKRHPSPFPAQIAVLGQLPGTQRRDKNRSQVHLDTDRYRVEAFQKNVKPKNELLLVMGFIGFRQLSTLPQKLTFEAGWWGSSVYGYSVRQSEFTTGKHRRDSFWELSIRTG